MKTCTKCQQTKALTEYHSKGEGNRLRADCKICVNSYNRNRKYINNPIRLVRLNNGAKVLSDEYVKRTLRQTKLPITKETIELKRLSILTRRLCKATSKN